VLQPGRARLEELVSAVPDLAQELHDPKQFFEGTDLLGRTQYIAKRIGLEFEYFFLAQDKQILAKGSGAEVIAHMNSLADAVAAKLHSLQATCVRLHLIDAGGDVLQTILAGERDMGERHASLEHPRSHRDVWSLLLAMSLKLRLGCELELVVVAPGVDGDSVWLGDVPVLENRRPAASAYVQGWAGSPVLAAADDGISPSVAGSPMAGANGFQMSPSSRLPS